MDARAARRKLSDLAAGYRITVTGIRVGSADTATHVEANKMRTKAAPSATTPAPTPSDSDAPEPTDSATPEPTDSTTPAPSTTPTDNPGA